MTPSSTPVAGEKRRAGYSPAHGVKHGMDWQSAREPLASLFYNRRHHIAKQQHAVERTRELFAKSLGYAKPQTVGITPLRAISCSTRLRCRALSGVSARHHPRR